MRRGSHPPHKPAAPKAGLPHRRGRQGCTIRLPPWWPAIGPAHETIAVRGPAIPLQRQNRRVRKCRFRPAAHPTPDLAPSGPDPREATAAPSQPERYKQGLTVWASQPGSPNTIPRRRLRRQRKPTTPARKIKDPPVRSKHRVPRRRRTVSETIETVRAVAQGGPLADHSVIHVDKLLRSIDRYLAGDLSLAPTVVSRSRDKL
jgi:hypothetical protein